MEQSSSHDGQPSPQERPSEIQMEDILAYASTVLPQLEPSLEGLDLSSTTELEGVGVSSVTLVELVFMIEEEFDLEPLDEDLYYEVVTLGDIARVAMTSAEV